MRLPGRRFRSVKRRPVQSLSKDVEHRALRHPKLAGHAGNVARRQEARDDLLSLLLGAPARTGTARARRASSHAVRLEDLPDPLPGDSEPLPDLPERVPAAVEKGHPVGTGLALQGHGRLPGSK